MNKASFATTSLDTYFSKRILEKAGAYTEERAQFLQELMQHSRLGHLCWKTSQAISLPPSIASEGQELFPSTPLVFQADRYYLHKNWVYETYLLQQIQRLRSLKPPLLQDPDHFTTLLQEHLQNGDLLPEQGDAIRSAFENSFSLICGGPGTGKTYTAGFLVRLLASSLKKRQFKVYLAAPTGKAAAHLSTTLRSQGALDPTLQIEATTLHRLLRLQPGEVRLFSPRKIDADLILVDEASMLDVSLMAHLLEAISEETKLILMGDSDQLPPVETGTLFAELASLFGKPLKKSLRTQQSQLHALASAINQGKSQEVEQLLAEEKESLQRLPWQFDDRLPSKLFDAARISEEEPDPHQCLQNLSRFCILSALRQGPFGTESLNQQILQEMSRRIRPGQWWILPILSNTNEPRLDLYNGTMGLLIGKSRGGIHFQEGTAYFPDQGSFRSFPRAPSFELAFSLSIHKSQGSEFERVLALFPPGSENFGREALYTAATRAKKRLEVMVEEEILQKMLAQHSRRMSGFTERFKP